MNTLVPSRCPYCGHKNTTRLELPLPEYPGLKVILCDTEEGGCDKIYAIRQIVEIYSESFFIEPTQEAQDA